MQRILRDDGHVLADPQQPAQREALIHRYCPPSIGNLFATPREGKNHCLEWWTELPGQPQHFAALSPAEQAQLKERMTQRLAALSSLIDELERRGDPVAAELRALPTQPTENTLYSVGGDPVLIRWAPVRSLAAPTPVASAASAAAAASPPPAAPSKQRRRWVVPVMLPLLLGGLALLGLWLGLHHGRFALPWPNGQDGAVPLSSANEGTRMEPVLGTGDVQVTLRWNSRDDLDLAVTAPSGETVSYTRPSSPSGGRLDVDSNARCSTSLQNPVENVFWNSGNAPEGEYVARVSLYNRCDGDRTSIPFELSITLDGNTETQTGTINDHSPNQSFEFVFP